MPQFSKSEDRDNNAYLLGLEHRLKAMMRVPCWRWWCAANGSYNDFSEAGEADNEEVQEEKEEEVMANHGQQSLYLILGPSL